jgi:hypothetical protein
MQEEAIISYNASDMILQVHSDAGLQMRKEHEAEQEDISFCQTTTPPLQTTAQY